ncbi:MAG: response regulator [Desulfobacteraceae bacterium]|nr:MAG: response regulator [Desulfobacteraceae bacterium]
MTDTPKKRILIIDDAPENIRIVTEILKDKYALTAATSGEKALKLAQSGTPPELILLDIMMPGIDGYEVCRRLKDDGNTKDIPVIFLTAKTAIEDEIRGFELGAVDYITKPISPPKVKARVRTHLNLEAARQKLEKQNLELIEAARLREDVDNIMQHDLKGPLNSIIALPNVLLQDQSLNLEQKESLKAIEQSGYRMLNMINLSLDLFKMEKGIYTFQPIPVNLIKVIIKIISDIKGIAKAKDVTLQILLDGHPPSEKNQFNVLAEELLCYSMFSNLIKNAVEASPEHEMVSVTFSRNNDGCISVHNTGVVPKSIRESFFDKYVTSGKRGGTGLGTYSARLMAENQKGTISLATSEADGTCISVHLPLAGEDVRASDEPGDRLVSRQMEELESRIAALPPLRVLIADDDEYSLKILTKYLDYPNLTVESAENGKAAAEKVSKGHIRMVFMDMEMPIMDGYQAMQEIRKWEQQSGLQTVHSRAPQQQIDERPIPIVVLSAHNEAKIRQHCLESGFSHYLVKPARKTELLETLLRFFEGENFVETEKNNEPSNKRNGTNQQYLVEIDADFKDIIPSFLNNKKEDIMTMQDALDRLSFEEIRKIGHKLKGTSSIYGFDYMSTLCFALEEAAKNQETDTIRKNINLLADYLANVIIKYVSKE